MPVLSAFTASGYLRMSSAPSTIERWYRVLPRMWGSQIDFTEVGSYVESKLYAVARLLALVEQEVERSGAQFDPTRVSDLLPLLEIDFQLAPGKSASMVDRRQALAKAELLPLGARASAVVAALRDGLGSAFLAYVPAPAGPSRTVYPSAPGSGPGAFRDVRQPAKLLSLVDPVVQIGGPAWVAYQALDPSAVPTTRWAPSSPFGQGTQLLPTLASSNGYIFEATGTGVTGTVEPTWTSAAGTTVADGTIVWECLGPIAPVLLPGEVVVIDVGNTRRMEPVTIAATSNTVPAGSNATPGYLYLQATFASAHDIGAPMTTGNVPYWWSTQRTNWIVLDDAPALAAQSRQVVDGLMIRMLRAVSRWSTLQVVHVNGAGTGGTVGPLSANAGMGTLPIGSFNFTFSA